MTDFTGHPIPHDPHSVGITYVAGPMTGYLEWNYPSFIEMTGWLRGLGFKVISPHELHDPDAGHPWNWYLRRDLEQLVKCSRIVMLDGWEKSRGANVEHDLAEKLDMSIFYPEEHHLLTRVVH